METLKEKTHITGLYSNAFFKFSNRKLIKSNKKIEIPVTIADTPVLLTTDMISSDIPQLQSTEAMKSANTVTDF